MGDWRTDADVLARIEAGVMEGHRRQADALLVSIQTDMAEGQYRSPIEAIFDAWWQGLSGFFRMEWAVLEAQHRVEIDGERFIVDFVVQMDCHPGNYGSNVWTDFPKVAIELDGHDFHERTREQVVYRNRRDRMLQGAGWQMLHVSGSELYRQPYECVFAILQQVNSAWMSFWPKYWEEVRRSQAAQRAAVTK